MWIEPESISRWAYFECSKTKNNEINNLIIDPKWSYLYCKTIEDIEEIRSNIKTPYWAFKYLKNVKDRPEIREIVKGSEWEYWLTRR